MSFKYAYLIIEKATNFCCQLNCNNKPDWVVDNEYIYNMPVDPATASDYLGKYYYNGKWWRREWIYEEVTDEEGNTYQRQTEEYTDYPWSPDESIN